MSKGYIEFKYWIEWFVQLNDIYLRHKKILSFHKYREIKHEAEKKQKKLHKQKLNYNSLSPHKRRGNNESI